MNDSPTRSGTSIDPVIVQRLREIYGEVPAGLPERLDAIVSRAAQHRSPHRCERQDLWDERDCVLITYADQIRDSEAGSPLQAMTRFLIEHGLDRLLPIVHLLPFCPSTSDDGFSVADYYQVDPQSGTWQDIDDLGRHVDLMFDLVLNHCSQKHDWFQRFLADESPFNRYFHSVDPDLDLSSVVRPRSLPLLSPFETASGLRHVWTTFSPDQVDLNYSQPTVLAEMAETFVQYAARGARIIRLDAVAFLWKEVGTDCLHRPQTHAVVRLLRHLVDRAVPGTLVLTETNVPHAENVSYFGEGDEAHMVYQFSLPPLILDALESGQTDVLQHWLATLRPPTPTTTFFNFTASHDGIGVRPLEGLVSDARLDAVIDRVRRHGGRVSTRRRGDGSDSPYELNITYLDAVAPPQLSQENRVSRFLTSQALMLAMQGIPAIYFQSLIGASSDLAAVEHGAPNRSINRHKYTADELRRCLADEQSAMPQIFSQFRQLLATRQRLPAMHPNASQRPLDEVPSGAVGFVRGEEDCTGPPISVLCNLSDAPVEFDRSALPDCSLDYLASQPSDRGATLSVGPHQIRWLGPSPG